MIKNVVSFYSEGRGQGLQIPINGLMEGDVVDASLLASRELTITWKASQYERRYAFMGKNIELVEITNNGALRKEWKGDISTVLKVSNSDTGIKRIVLKGSVTYLSLEGNSDPMDIDVTQMPCLEVLKCIGNELASLDVSNCVALKELDCKSNQLTSLDISKNVALTTLYCNNNPLSSLDLSKNVALTYLDCSNNQLTSLDLPKNGALANLFCYSNQLTSLNISKNIALTYLDCNTNQLTSLDLRDCKKLEEAYINANNLPLVYFAEGLEEANVLYAYPTEESENNLDDFNAQIWALPEVESASLYISDGEDIVFSQLDEEAIAQANARGWQIINGEY